MTQIVPFETMTQEETNKLLQQRVTMFTGYAFALAQKVGLTPEEAAQFFMEPHRADYATPSTSISRDEILEMQARNSAMSMAVSHGGSNVQLESDNDTWLVKVMLAQDKSIIEQWGISLEFLARWLGEQARLIGEPKGVVYTCWLDGEVLNVQLKLASNKQL